MKPSSQSLIGGIANTIERDVLPDMEASSWPASRLRSCLMLLRHLEQRVVIEGPLLFKGNLALQDLLDGLSPALCELPGGTDLVHEIDTIRLQLRALDTYPTVDELAEVNDEYQHLLEEIICLLHDKRSVLGEKRFSELNGRIIAHLRQIKREDAPMIDAAAGTSPI